uniref:Uncharacterized protein n=2 Tax=Cucumis melo TaxID=3656 RepID=A0A9I9E9E6_CUCME
MLAPRCGRALQVCLSWRLLRAWRRGLAITMGLSVGQGVRAGVELMLGWACADNACTSMWACTPSGLVR